MPTNFQNMRDRVIEFTKRPELVTLTDNAIKMATLRAHHVDFFPRDYANFLATYTPPVNGTLSVDLPTIYTSAPLLRTLDFIQGEDASTFLPAENFEHVTEYKDFWDEDNLLRDSVFTQMGESIRIRAASFTGRCRVYYYKNPDTTFATYSSWIADSHMEELAYWAAGIVWARSGFQEMAKQSYEHVEMFKQMLVESYLSSKK